MNDINLKKDRLKILKKYNNFIFHKLNINNQKKLLEICNLFKIEIIIFSKTLAAITITKLELELKLKTYYYHYYYYYY